jgi:transposase
MVLDLSADEKVRLEFGYKNSSNFPFSRRFHIILLKSAGRSSKDIASFLGVTDQAANNWVKRFSSAGIDGFQTKTGQGNSHKGASTP